MEGVCSVGWYIPVLSAGAVPTCTDRLHENGNLNVHLISLPLLYCAAFVGANQNLLISSKFVDFFKI